MRSRPELLGVHARLREGFAVHPDFAVRLEFVRALRELEAFEAELRASMDVEEAHLVPLYRARARTDVAGEPGSAGRHDARWTALIGSRRSQGS